MKLKYKYTLILLLCVFVGRSQGFTDIKSTQELKKQMKEVADNIKTIKADFVQEKHLEVLDVVVESKGKFMFKSPQKLRWEYTTPFHYLVLMNNGKLKIVQDENVQEFDVNSNKTFQNINELIMNSITGNLLDNKQFTIKAKENKSAYKLLLTPKDKNVGQVLKEIEILISKTDKTVEQLTMYESKSDFTKIKFSNKKLNENISDNNFIQP